MITSASRTVSATLPAAPAPVGHELLHRTGRAIEADHAVAGLDQMAGHRPTHDAEANERNRAHSRITFSCRSQRRLSIVVVVGMYSSPT